MPLTITLHRTAPNEVEVHIRKRIVSRFDPQPLLHFEASSENPRLPREPIAYGKRLCVALGGAAFGRRLRRISKGYPDGQIRLVIADPELDRIAWEFLYYARAFVMEDYTIVRVVPGTKRPRRQLYADAIQLIAIGSQPLVEYVRNAAGEIIGSKPLPPLVITPELDTIELSLREEQFSPTLRWHYLPPTIAALNSISSREQLVLHYTGPWIVIDGEPYLCFEDSAGGMQPLAVRDLPAQVKQPIYLVCLNLCHHQPPTDCLVDPARILIQAGIPAVISIPHALPTSTVESYVYRLYNSLSDHMPPWYAADSVRGQISSDFDDNPHMWGSTVMYEAQGHEWLDIHALSLSLTPIDRGPIKLHNIYVPDKIYGRQAEQVELLRLFRQAQAQVVTIWGTAGSGKTVLAGMLVDRLRSDYSDGVYGLNLWVTADGPGLNAADLRQTLAQLFGLRSSAFDAATNAEAQATALLGWLREHPQSLLMLDHYDTILERLDAPSTPESYQYAGDQAAEAQAIHQLVQRLAGAGVRLLITARRAPIGLPGEVLFPDPGQQAGLATITPAASREVFGAYILERKWSLSMVDQLAVVLDHQPFALKIAAKCWEQYSQDAAAFVDAFASERAKLVAENVLAEQPAIMAAIEVALKLLKPELYEQWLQLSLVASPVIHSAHSAGLRGKLDTTAGHILTSTSIEFYELADIYNLGLLEPHILERGADYPETYALHPLVAKVIAARAATVPDVLATAQTHYAAWLSAVIDELWTRKRTHRRLNEIVAAALPDLVVGWRGMPAASRAWFAWRAAVVLANIGQRFAAVRLLQTAAMLLATQADELLRPLIQLTQILHHPSATSYEQIRQAKTMVDPLVAALGDRGERAKVLLLMAELWQNHQQLEQAQQAYTAALACLEQLDAWQRVATTHQHLAQLWSKQSKFAQALNHLNHALALYEQHNDLAGKAATLRAIAAIWVARGEVEHGIDVYDDALACAEQTENDHVIIAALHDMVTAYLQRGLLDPAQQLLARADAMSSRLWLFESRIRTDLLMGQLCEQRGEQNEATNNYHTAIALGKHEGYLLLEAWANWYLGRINFNKIYDRYGLALVRESMELFEQAGASDELAELRTSLEQMERTIQERWGHYDDGGSQDEDETSDAEYVEDLVISTIVSLRGDVPQELADFMFKAAALFFDGEDFIAALEALVKGKVKDLQQVLIIAADLLVHTPVEQQQTIYEHLNTLALQINDRKAVVATLQQIILLQRSLEQSNENVLDLSHMLCTLALVHIQDGEPALALPLLEEALVLDQQTANPSQAKTQELLAQVRLKMKKRE